MKHFFEQLAQRVAKGESGLVGNEFTFEQAWHAQDLEAALKEQGIPCAVVKFGQQFKVRLAELPTAETGGQAMDQLMGGTPLPGAAPAESSAPSAIKGTEASAKIPHLTPEASEPVPGILPAKEKRGRFAELARQEHVETASKLAEKQAQLELSFSPPKKAAKGRKRP